MEPEVSHGFIGARTFWSAAGWGSLRATVGLVAVEYSGVAADKNVRAPSAIADRLFMARLLCFGWLVFVIVLAGHDAEVAKPFGKENDHHAAQETEYRSEEHTSELQSRQY